MRKLIVASVICGAVLAISGPVGATTGIVTHVTAPCGSPGTPPIVSVAATYKLQSFKKFRWGTVSLRAKDGRHLRYKISYQTNGPYQEIGTMVVPNTESGDDWLYVQGVVNFVANGTFASSFGLTKDICEVL